jgi:methylated-DNA-[protein]-cysteine S-methyltransferase
MATITLSTPAGPYTVIASDSSVLAAGFTADEEALLALVHPDLPTAGDADLDLISKAVAAYFDGDLTAVDAVAVEQRTGGAFQAHAWDVMRGIRPGEPVTYREFAELAGRPAAVRAAAAACARNAAALFVPCHRVVRTDGGMGGYRWGLEIKRLLLAHERQMTKRHS